MVISINLTRSLLATVDLSKTIHQWAEISAALTLSTA
jgi:hypothetical protein